MQSLKKIIIYEIKVFGRRWRKWKVIPSGHPPGGKVIIIVSQENPSKHGRVRFIGNFRITLAPFSETISLSR